MATNLEVVSRVQSALNAISKDNRIPRRYILQVLRDSATMLISQKLGDRSLYKDTNPYTTISCFEMEEFDVVKCDIVEFKRCKSLMRSKNKLPKLIDSKYGHSIKEVTSIDDEFEFEPITLAQYRRNKDRKNYGEKYFYVKDGYLYLPDTDVTRVNLYLITLHNEDIKSCEKNNECKSLWEYEFNAPDKLLDVIINQTTQIIGIRKNIIRDDNANTQEGV
jgi:hypothetical protein